MELGNLIFCNSRGEYPVDRAWQDDFCEFLRECGIDGRGYYDKEDQFQTERGGFENDVFLVNPYDWGVVCTCGFDDMDYKWWQKNKHTDQCFFTRIHKLDEQLKKQGYAYWSEEWNRAIDKFAEENGYDRSKGVVLVYCDCGLYEKYDEWVKDKGHKEDCRFVQPNFLYKPTGFQIQWYKYPLRDSYMNQNITFEELKKIMEYCKESARR